MESEYEIVKRLRVDADTVTILCGDESNAIADAIEHLTKERDELLVNARKNMEEKVKLRQELRKEQEAVLFVVGQRDAAIARAEAAEEDYRELAEERLAVRDEWATMRKDRDALRALLIETRPFVQDSVGFTHHELRARIAAATGDDNGK